MTNPKVTIKNFTNEDLKCKCGCGRINYNEEFLIRLQAFRLRYNKPLTTTCGGRCIKHNKDVGGVSTSLHQNQTKTASAIDVTGVKCNDIFTEACLSGLFNEVEYHKKENFVHLGWDPNQKGNSFKVI